MSVESRYPIPEELFEKVNTIVAEVDGLIFSINVLTENAEQGKRELWEAIYKDFPDLRGKMMTIDGPNQEIVCIGVEETSIIETLPED